MIETVTVIGMVISTMAISEYDKRLVLLTKEFGKITAFARGARKTTSQFLAGSQPMAFGEFTLYRGRNAYTVTSMKISDYFSSDMKDIESMYMGMYFLELADYYGREGIEAGETLKLLYMSMKALSKNMLKKELIRCIFELRILVIEKENLDYFDEKNNTMICSNCHGKVSEKNIIDNSTIYALQYIVTSPITRLFSFDVTDKVLEQMKGIINKYIKKHIDRKFNSLEFLEI